MSTTTTRTQAAQPKRSRDVGGSTRPPAADPISPTDPRAVTATAAGFYGSQRIKVGQVFLLDDPKHFSKKWMRHGSKPAPAAPAAPALPAGPTGDQNPLGGDV